jgi:alkylation response protein AidB-like acyl-CoA dehydrogenase
MSFEFTLPPRSPQLEQLRHQVREFLAVELDDMSMVERAHTWHGFNPEFSRKVAAQGWVGMVWPKQYGGGECTALERYVVLEEMVNAGAPVSLHWTGDRQSGPLLLKLGTEAQRQQYLPRLAKGEIFFCIGLSEPDAGSDLANLRTRAVKVDGGWVINGTKIWTTGAHLKHYMIMLARSEPRDENKRHAGMSQFVVDLKSAGVQIRPIQNLAGEHYFNEVVFTDCFVSDDGLIGEEGNGWKQAMAELALERSGPERFLTASIMMQELVRLAAKYPSQRASIAVGKLSAELVTLRRMSFAVASAMQQGVDVGIAGSFVKDLGSVFEQSIPDIARDLFEIAELDDEDFLGVYRYIMLASPSFSIYGGTREILRSIIGKSLIAE